MKALTQTQRDQLVRLEAEIEDGLATFYAVGKALLEIRDQRLYRSSHDTWEDYCRTRWKMSRVHAWRLIEAAGVAESVPVGNEAQARELVPLDPQQRQEVWTEATAGGEQPTAARLHELAAKALASLSPEEQQTVIEGAERQVLDRAAPPRQVGGEGRAARIAQAVRLLARARKLIEGLGDEAIPMLGVLADVVGYLERLPGE